MSGFIKVLWIFVINKILQENSSSIFHSNVNLLLLPKIRNTSQTQICNTLSVLGTWEGPLSYRSCRKMQHRTGFLASHYYTSEKVEGLLVRMLKHFFWKKLQLLSYNYHKNSSYQNRILVKDVKIYYLIFLYNCPPF